MIKILCKSTRTKKSQDEVKAHQDDGNINIINHTCNQRPNPVQFCCLSHQDLEDDQQEHKKSSGIH